ncbi:MarR family winged helix-turn-helix transcriptional regulator [Catenulispora rubra]|uniref:MarR family winged helix-turn-helix transcriptional regulator n=1 Tax=Catenulispora rubra TaxID=280293 RepID=UPI0018925C22|nr:MarR family transcriptional regulator [Catenulispora rubra]
MAAARRHPAPADDPRWAELADLALVIAREIQVRGYQDPQAVPLTQTEGSVMRHLNENGGEHDGTAPSMIAAATGLQRTNLATVLTGLQRKGLIERRASPQDGRAASIHTTEHGRTNYVLVHGEWGQAVSTAAGHEADTGKLNTALEILRAVRDGLIGTRPAGPGRPPTLM